MKKNIFAPKRNEVLEAVAPAINKLTRTQKIFTMIECVLFVVMIVSIVFLFFI